MPPPHEGPTITPVPQPLMLFSALLLTLAAPAAALPQDPPATGTLLVRDRLLAVVNDQILTEGDLRGFLTYRMGLQPGQQPTEDMLQTAFGELVADLMFREGWRLAGRDEALLERIVQDELDARIDRAGSLAALSAEMAASGSSVDEFKRYFRRMVVGVLYQQIEIGRQPEKGSAVKVALYVSPRQIREHYDKQQSFYTTQRRAQGRILMVPKGDAPAATAEAVASIRQQIAVGALSFADAVEQHSSFRKSTGGKTGWVTDNSSWSPLVKDFLLQGEPGSLSEPLDLGADWAVVVLETLEAGGVTPFDQVQEEIREELLQAQYTEIRRGALERIRKRCYVWPEQAVDEALSALFATPGEDL